MKQKDLEILLSRFQNFKEPNVHLEQYQTPPRLVALITWRAFQLGDIKDKIVVDLCCGTGLFAIAAKILGAKKVYGIEIDPDVIRIAKENAKLADVEVEFINKDIRKIDLKADTALMNSPFGVQGTVKDQEFLLIALRNAIVSYTIHLYQEKNIEFLRKFIQKNKKKTAEIIKAEFEIPRIYKFHKKRYHIIEVAILRSI